MSTFNPEIIKALALDLDGTTLLSGAVMGDRTIRALRRCLEKGLRVILCTGRSVQSAERYRACIGAQGPMVCFNGAITADMPGGTIISAVFPEREIVEFCIGLARERGIYYQVYFAEKGDPFREVLIAERDASEAELYRGHTQTQAVFGDLPSALNDPRYAGCIKSMFITSAELIEEIRPLIIERFGGRVYVTKSSPLFLEVLAPGVSKGAGLTRIMERLGLRPEEVIAFGDEENDLPLFKAALHSAAPANAKPEVRAAAEFHIPSCDDEGVAAFLEEHLLR
jgi:Cof subfamily protein (haloacid dehalogenase superfamily)